MQTFRLLIRNLIVTIALLVPLGCHRGKICDQEMRVLRINKDVFEKLMERQVDTPFFWDAVKILLFITKRSVEITAIVEGNSAPEKLYLGNRELSVPKGGSVVIKASSPEGSFSPLTITILEDVELYAKDITWNDMR
jgi:hypothetical protein